MAHRGSRSRRARVEIRPAARSRRYSIAFAFSGTSETSRFASSKFFGASEAMYAGFGRARSKIQNPRFGRGSRFNPLTRRPARISPARRASPYRVASLYQYQLGEKPNFMEAAL